MFKKLKKFFYLYILRKKYYRVGSCNACGRCCQKIYVKHKNVIQTEEEFKKLQKLHPFYTYLKIIDKDETGLVFECMNLEKASGNLQTLSAGRTVYDGRHACRKLRLQA